MMKVRDHQLDSPRIIQLEQTQYTIQSNLKSVQSEVVDARTSRFRSLGSRLDFIMQNAGGPGGGGGLDSYEELTPAASSTSLTFTSTYMPGTQRLLLYYNGMLLRPGVDADYTETDGTGVVLNFATSEGDRFTSLVMGQEGVIVARDLAKANFKIDMMYQSGSYGGSVAYDVFTDDTGVDYTRSSGFTYDSTRQRMLASASGGTLVTASVSAGIAPNEAVLHLDTDGIQVAEVSRDDGASYIAVSTDALTDLSSLPTGTHLRVRLTIAAGGRLRCWGIVWR